MSRAVAGALAALAFAWAVWPSSSAASVPPVQPPNPGDPMTHKQRLYAQLRALPMLTEDQRLALMLVAHGESGYKPTAFNRSASEAAAAGRAYDRLAEQGRLNAACAYTRAELAVGSAGRFQRLVPYFVNDLRDVVPCLRVAQMTDGLHDLVSAIATAAALTRNRNWNGRVSGLRGGWGTLAWLDGAPADKLEKWTRHAREGGFAGTNDPADAAAFLRRTLTPFPSDLGAVLEALEVAAVPMS